MIDYYKILGLTPNASQDEIKTAYRKLSKKFHPDLNEGDKFFEERFKEIQEAYEKLSDTNFKNFQDKKNSTQDYSFKNEQNTKQENKPPNNQTNSTKQTINPQKNNRFSKTIVSIILIIIFGIIIGAIQKSIREKAINDSVNSYVPVEANVDSTKLVNTSLSSSNNNVSVPVNTQSYSTDSTSKNITSTQATNSIDSLKSKQQNNEEKNLPGKKETEEWILQKLNSYSTDYTYCPSNDINYLVPCTTYKNFSFIFNGDYLEIRYSENKSNLIEKIPLYDFNYLYNKYTEITFFNKENTIIETTPIDNAQQVVPCFTIGFKTDAETDLVKRLESAFKHLSQFYSKPKSNEAF